MTSVQRAPSEDLACVILVNWNGWRDTLQCLESCAKLAYPHLEIIVVDNGSTDDSVARLRERFPGLRLIETGANLGFAGGNNAGLHAALSMGARSTIVRAGKPPFVEGVSVMVSILPASRSRLPP